MGLADVDFEVIRKRTATTRVAPPLHVISKRTSASKVNEMRPDTLELPDDYFVKELPVKSRDPSGWGEETEFVCLHDCHAFTGLVISVPVSYDQCRGYEMMGQFCSFSCALSYVIHSSDYHVSKISNMIHRIAVEVYDFTHNIKPAPPREVLQMFRLDGSGLSIDEFRLSSCKPVQITLVRAPFWVAPEFMVSRPLRGHPDHHQISHIEHMTSRASGTPSYVQFSPSTMDPLHKRSSAASSTQATDMRDDGERREAEDLANSTLYEHDAQVPNVISSIFQRQQQQSSRKRTRGAAEEGEEQGDPHMQKRPRSGVQQEQQQEGTAASGMMSPPPDQQPRQLREFYPSAFSPVT